MVSKICLQYSGQACLNFRIGQRFDGGPEPEMKGKESMEPIFVFPGCSAAAMHL